MGTVSVNRNGELTIPLALREKLGVMDGGELELIDFGDGVCGLIAVGEDIRSLKGIVKKPKTPVTLEDMDKAIRRRAAHL